jgi:hypothetical protein
VSDAGSHLSYYSCEEGEIKTEFTTRRRAPAAFLNSLHLGGGTTGREGLRPTKMLKSPDSIG